MVGDTKNPWDGNLRGVFNTYCPGYQSAKMMDGKSFAKLIKDSGLLDHQLTETDVDLTFAKIKDRSERRISFQQFQTGLAVLAKRKGASLADIQRDIDKRKGPILHGTIPEQNKLHDDKTLYTGVHANGGPETGDRDRRSGGSQILNRSESDVRGVKKATLPARSRNDSATTVTLGRSKSVPTLPAPCPGSRQLREVFEQFCSGGQKCMDGWEFAKLSRDCGLLDDDLTATDVDLVFLKVKDRAEKRIAYEQFLLCLALLASKKGVDTAEIEAQVKASEGPILNGTRAEANRFHDDKAFYTGVQARGQRDGVENARHANNITMPSPCHDTKQMREVFKQYCTPGQKTSVMDSAYFAKLARDCELLDDSLDQTNTDLIFVRVKNREEKRIGFGQFLLALALMAQRKGVSNEEVEAAVLRSHGPILNATRPEQNRLHDDKAQYTGVHAHGGPSIVDHHRVDLRTLLDRSDADPRGGKDGGKTTRDRRALRNVGARLVGMKQNLGVPRGAVSDSPALQRVFNAYAQQTDAGGMASGMFLRLVRDVRLLDSELTPSKVNAVFARARQSSDPRLSYHGFLTALTGLAAEKSMHVEALVARVEVASGPSESSEFTSDALTASMAGQSTRSKLKKKQHQQSDVTSTINAPSTEDPKHPLLSCVPEGSGRGTAAKLTAERVQDASRSKGGGGHDDDDAVLRWLRCAEGDHVKEDREMEIPTHASAEKGDEEEGPGGTSDADAEWREREGGRAGSGMEEEDSRRGDHAGVSQ